jgi:hypothetical protein
MAIDTDSPAWKDMQDFLSWAMLHDWDDARAIAACRLFLQIADGFNASGGNPNEATH